MSLKALERMLVVDSGFEFRFRTVFSNGYGVSVVRSSLTYGSEQGLYELAVLGRDGSLCYDTPVTDDVLGWLSVEEVLGAAEAVSELG